MFIKSSSGITKILPFSKQCAQCTGAGGRLTFEERSLALVFRRPETRSRKHTRNYRKDSVYRTWTQNLTCVLKKKNREKKILSDFISQRRAATNRIEYTHEISRLCNLNFYSRGIPRRCAHCFSVCVFFYFLLFYIYLYIIILHYYDWSRASVYVYKRKLFSHWRPPRRGRPRDRVGNSLLFCLFFFFFRLFVITGHEIKIRRDAFGVSLRRAYVYICGRVLHTWIGIKSRVFSVIWI